MSTTADIIMFVVVPLITVFSAIFVGVWNNWIWLGKDGYNLPQPLRPGFFRFWFVIAPRACLFMSTSMESVTLQKSDREVDRMLYSLQLEQIY